MKAANRLLPLLVVLLVAGLIGCGGRYHRDAATTSTTSTNTD